MAGLGSKLDYSSKGHVLDPETDQSITLCQTVNAGINTSVISFNIPRDSQRFSDLNSVLLKVVFHVENGDGSKLDEEKDKVFLDPLGMHSFWTSCDVRFDGKVVSTMSSYPQTAALCRKLACSKDYRSMLTDLEGTLSREFYSSDLLVKDTGNPGNYARFIPGMDLVKGSKRATLYGRLYSDVLMSSRQYLPPDIELGIDLRKGNDAFSVKSVVGGKSYRLVLESCSLFIKRLALRPGLIPRPLESIKEGASMVFNRLDNRIRSIEKGQKVWSWLDCLSGLPLPNRVYVAFIRQAGFYGSHTYTGTYFEALNLSSYNFKWNGQDLMVEPIVTEYVTGKVEDDGTTYIDFDKSDARAAYLAMLELIDGIKNTTESERVTYIEYIQGFSILCLELSKVGEKLGAEGNLDLHLTFGGEAGSDMDACVLVMTERTDVVNLGTKSSHVTRM